MTEPPPDTPAIAVPDRPQVDGGEPNGFVVVVLDRDVDPDPGRDLVDVLRDPAPGTAPPDRLLAALAALDGPRTSRLVGPGSVRAVRALQRRGAAGDGPPRLDLTRFWRIDLRDGRADAQDVALRLRDVPGVVLAYAESRVAPTTSVVPPGAPDRGPAPTARAATSMLAQGHLAAAPTGVGATAVRDRCGVRGTGVRVADVERGWRLSHPAYAVHAPAVVTAAPLGNCDGDATAAGTLIGDHGTAVLGVVAATGPGVRVVGVAPGVEKVVCGSHHDVAADTDMHVVEAVAQAATHLRRGDVLLLEVTRAGGVLGGRLPAEIDPSTFLALVAATGAGIVVVEAAGNGERDLDAWRHPTDAGRRMLRGDPASDSGAIVVGSCGARTGTVGHLRFSSSNFGVRVDCHAWGELVATATATATAEDYTTNFKETSAAAAIVAGVACAAQGMQLAAHPGVPLAPSALRALLSDGAHTPQQPETPHRAIGPMPDLVVVADRIGAAVCPPDDDGGVR